MVVGIWDIDGPLNPYLMSGIHTDGRYYPWGTRWNSGWFNLVEHPGWMQSFVDAGVTMRWGSYWLDETVIVSEFLGLEEFPFIRLRKPQGNSDCTWKLPSIQAFLDEHHHGEPAFWLDDELESDAYAWAEERGNTLLVKVDPKQGWVAEEYELMMRFVEKFR